MVESTPTKSIEQAWLNQTAAARYLGISPSMLCKLAKQKGGVYAPTRGLPGVPEAKVVRYHIEQLRLLDRVSLGELSLADADQCWEVRRQRLAMGESTKALSRER